MLSQVIVIMVRGSFSSVIIIPCLSVAVMGQYENCTGDLNSINDGRCDQKNNIVDCGFDGGDCCDSSCSNDRLFPCGVWGYNCSDPDVVDDTGPCATDILQTWVVKDTASATFLAKAVNCSGGTFDVKWHGSILIDRTISIPEGTTVTVTGEGSGAEVKGGGKERLFTVQNAALHINGLVLIGGNATYGGAIAATHSNISFNHTSFIANIASSYGGAVYLARGSAVTWNGQTEFTDNHCRLGGGAVAVSITSNARWSGSTEFYNNSCSSDS